jgi:hypothetical protein
LYRSAVARRPRRLRIIEGDQTAQSRVEIAKAAGDFVIFGHSDGTVSLRGLNNEAKATEFSRFTVPVCALALSDDGTLAAAAADVSEGTTVSSEIRIWEISPLREVFHQTVPFRVMALAFAKGTSRLGAACANRTTGKGSVLVWDQNPERELIELSKQMRSATAIPSKFTTSPAVPCRARSLCNAMRVRSCPHSFWRTVLTIFYSWVRMRVSQSGTSQTVVSSKLEGDWLRQSATCRLARAETGWRQSAMTGRFVSGTGLLLRGAAVSIQPVPAL